MASTDRARRDCSVEDKAQKWGRCCTFRGIFPATKRRIWLENDPLDAGKHSIRTVLQKVDYAKRFGTNVLAVTPRIGLTRLRRSGLTGPYKCSVYRLITGITNAQGRWDKSNLVLWKGWNNRVESIQSAVPLKAYCRSTVTTPPTTFWPGSLCRRLVHSAWYRCLRLLQSRNGRFLQSQRQMTPNHTGQSGNNKIWLLTQVRRECYTLLKHFSR